MTDYEQVLFVCRSVDLFRIPPRAASTGHKSGEWRVQDKVFTARCRVVARGGELEVRLEDPNTGELYGVCPIPQGQISVAVEPASDSSRNFVLRLVDPTSGRHAFLGMNFAERSAAFDFSVALSDHERLLQREREVASICNAPDPVAAAIKVLPEAAALYRQQDFQLKEGETIRVSIGGRGATGGSAKAAPSPVGGSIPALAPPPLPAPRAPPSAPAAPAAEEGWATFT